MKIYRIALLEENPDDRHGRALDGYYLAQWLNGDGVGAVSYHHAAGRQHGQRAGNRWRKLPMDNNRGAPLTIVAVKFQ